MQLPTCERQWKAIADGFNKRWNFPHCIGAIDGKHVVIQRPQNTVSEYYNYKGTQSIILLAIVDPNYCFTYVNVGSQGRVSDGGVFKNTSFYRKLDNGELPLPEDEPLPGRTLPVSYLLVADDAFGLSTRIMKPYVTDLNRGSPKRVFNYRLSRARRIVENGFGLLAAVFRIFRKPIEIRNQSTVIDIVLTCVYLHNFLRLQPDSGRFYSPPGSLDSEDASTGQIIPGSWRDLIANDTGMIPFRPVPRNASRLAQVMRDEFTNYFMSDEGSVPFQQCYL